MKDIPVCGNCGSVKFKRRDQLSEDEWDIARRLVGDPTSDHSALLYCARCLMPRRDDPMIV